MGCRELEIRDYFHFVEAPKKSHSHVQTSSCTPKNAYSGFSHTVIPNYRYYSPELGRWLNRDPLGEKNFFKAYTKEIVNVTKRDRIYHESLKPRFLFVSNNPLTIIDHDGAMASSPTIPPPGYVTIPPPFPVQYTRTVNKCEIAIFYGHHWSDNSNPGLQQLQVNVQPCGYVGFIACNAAYLTNNPSPLPGFDPPTTLIGWYGNQGVSGFLKRAKAAAKKAAKFLKCKPCCCKKVTVTIEGIATSWISDPDYDEEYGI